MRWYEREAGIMKEDEMKIRWWEGGRERAVEQGGLGWGVERDHETKEKRKSHVREKYPRLKEMGWGGIWVSWYLW